VLSATRSRCCSFPSRAGRKALTVAYRLGGDGQAPGTDISNEDAPAEAAIPSEHGEHPQPGSEARQVIFDTNRQ
jgi:hypothetical protein